MNTQSSEFSGASDADMQRYESFMSWRAHDGEVYSVEFSYDENTVLSIGEDGKVCLFILWKTHHIPLFDRHKLGASAGSELVPLGNRQKISLPFHGPESHCRATSLLHVCIPLSLHSTGNTKHSYNVCTSDASLQWYPNTDGPTHMCCSLRSLCKEITFDTLWILLKLNIGC